jgi:NAD(P)-dependent dehydrogenase (short-subunit alcohol dehydrogenase family)
MDKPAIPATPFAEVYQSFFADLASGIGAATAEGLAGAAAAVGLAVRDVEEGRRVASNFTGTTTRPRPRPSQGAENDVEALSRPLRLSRGAPLGQNASAVRW